MPNNSISLSWLHLSDLHRCPNRDGGGAEIVLGRLLKDLEKLIEQVGRPDLLFFTGDLAFGSLPDSPLEDQLLEGASWLEKVAIVVSIPPERCFIVPGNHDVDRKKVTPATQLWLREKARIHSSKEIGQLVEQGGMHWDDYARRLDTFRSSLTTLWSHLHWFARPLAYAHTVEVEGFRIGIAGFDSAWSCGEDDEKGKLWLAAEYQLSLVLPALENADVKIALIHHPPSWLVESEDPGLLRSRLQAEFHVVLHGHEHEAWVETPQPDHLQVAAGAAHDRAPGTEFGYNLARFEDATGKAEIWIRKWEPMTGDWLGNQIGKRTDERGVWHLPYAPWAAAPLALPAPEPASEPQAIGPKFSLSPAEERGLFGRSQDLESAKRNLTDNRLLWIHGLSGIGKTKLIEEIAAETEREYRSIRLMPSMSFEEIFSRLAQELGSRDPDPRPIGIGGILNFDVLRTWGRNLSRPRLVHIEGGDALFGRDAEKARKLLGEAASKVPLVALVVEGTIEPKAAELPSGCKRLHLRGLDLGCLAALFLRPLPHRPEVGWQLNAAEISVVAERVAGDRSHRTDLHPMALFLLVLVADELDLRPPEVFELYKDRFHRELKEALFDLLYERALGSSERRMLRLVALYREGVTIPERHLDALSDRVGDPRAFGLLVRRAVIEQLPEGFRLHSLLRKLAESLLSPSKELLGDHEILAHSWLENAKRGQRFGLSDVAANNESFHHLEKAERYAEMADLQVQFLRADVPRRLEEINLRLRKDDRLAELRIILDLWRRVEPDNPKPHSFLGETISKLEGKSSDEARQCFERALELRPDFPNNWANLGRCLLARNEGNQFVKRIDSLDSKLRLRIENDFVLSVFARCLENAGHRERASAARGARIKAGSRDPVLFNDEAKSLQGLGHLSEALALLEEALSRGIEDAFLISIRSDLLGALGRGEEASKERLNRIAAGSLNPALFVDEAKHLQQLGRLPEALALLEEAQGRGIEDDFVISIRGNLLGALGRGEEASKERLKRIAAGTLNHALFVDEAKYLQKLGHLSEALELLEVAKNRGIEDDFVVSCRADILRARSRDGATTLK